MLKEDKKKIVFVLGMHRSGTSLTAEIVHSMGFAVPGHSLDAIDSINAHGFWESQEVVDFDEGVLSAAQLKWYHICPVGHIFKNTREFDKRVAEMSEFLKVESGKHGSLVIKDPRLCLLWPLWFAAADRSVYDVKVIFVNRHPSSIASSIKKRDGFSTFSVHLLWLYYFFSVFSAKDFPELLYLNYEDILADDWETELISGFLGVNRISCDDWMGIVDPALQRNPGTQFSENNAISELENRVYRAFSHGAIYKSFDFLSKEAADFDKFIFNSSDLIFALNESNNCIVESRSDLVLMGAMHSEALEVIKEKDFAIFENSAYIDSCHGRIAELDVAVLELNNVRSRLLDVENQLSFCKEDSARKSDYIVECEGRIFNLEFSSYGFIALRAQLAKTEAVLRQKEADAKNNEEYIAKADVRISELESALVEFEALRARIAEVESVLRQKEKDAEHNLAYISECHARISELDDLFLQQRNNYLSALNTISQFEQKLANRNAEFFSVMDGFSALRGRLEGLLSWKIVRVIDRFLSKKGASSD
jgi:hypothetical protein